MRDDGIGVHVINALSKYALPQGVELIDGGTGCINLVPYIEDADALIVVDAVDVGRSPGEIVELSEDALAPLECPISLHDLRIGDAIRMAQLRATHPHRVVLMGIQIAEIAYGESLSPELATRLDEYAHAVLDKINAIRSECTQL